MNKSVLFLILIFGVFLSCRDGDSVIEQEPYNWKNVDITGGGFVSGIVYHPNEKNLRYARTDMGGAYRWEEKEKEWKPLLDWIGYEDYNLMGVESIALNPKNPDDLYLACGTYTASDVSNGAVLVSHDRGETFTRVDVPFKMGGNENGRGNGERMAVDPVNGNIIYLGTRHAGLWRSKDKGQTWHKVTSFPDVTEFDDSVDERTRRYGGGSGVVFVLFQNSGDGEVRHSKNIFVGVSLLGRENLFQSQDGGETWSPVRNHPEDFRPTQGVLSNNDDLIISYADNPGPMRMRNGGVWKYNIENRYWTDITPQLPVSGESEFGYASVSVASDNPEYIITSTHYRPGGDEIFRSLDGGKLWIPVFESGVEFDYSKAPYVKHTPVHWMFDIEIDPFNSDHVLFTTGYGGHETFNFGDVSSEDPVIWHILSQGIEETVPLALHSPKEGPQLYSAIGDYCGFAHHNFDESAAGGCFENPHFSNTDDITTAAKKQKIVVRVGRASHHMGGAHIGYSTDYGKTWTPCVSSPAENSMLGHVAVSADGATWIWTPKGEKPYLTTDRGISWLEVEELPEDTRVIADPNEALRFFALSSSDSVININENIRVFMVSLPEEVKLSGFRGDKRGGQDRLYAVPGQKGHLWFAGYDGLRFSEDRGESWIVKPTVNEMHAFGLGKAAPDTDYPALYMVGVVGNVRGIFRSDNKARSWILINDDENQWGLVLHITGDPKKYGRAYVGTHGRGIFYGDILQ